MLWHYSTIYHYITVYSRAQVCWWRSIYGGLDWGSTRSRESTQGHRRQCFRWRYDRRPHSLLTLPLSYRSTRLKVLSSHSILSLFVCLMKKATKPFRHSLQLISRKKTPTSIQHLTLPSFIQTFSAFIVWWRAIMLLPALRRRRCKIITMKSNSVFARQTTENSIANYLWKVTKQIVSKYNIMAVKREDSPQCLLGKRLRE